MKAPLPLDGILVADFSRVLAGPYAAMTLGDLGADVVKVERPGTGDDTRAWGPPWAAGTSTYYLGLNRNKLGVTLDLTDDADRARAFELARRADVVVENFRPGVMDRLGLGHGDVSVANPGVVYCSISGFGTGDEAARLPGYDLLVQAASGLMSITGDPDGPPFKVGVALVDHIAALQATVGILAALRHRTATGRGQRVEVSLMGAALTALLNQASGYLATGRSPQRMGNRHPSIAPYEPFRASDGWLVVACGNDGQFQRLAAVVGRHDLASDPRFSSNTARVAHVDELAALLAARFADESVAEWVAALDRAGVPAGPINDVGDAFERAVALGIEPVVTSGEVATTRSPIGMSETAPSVRLPPPALGEHDAEVRTWLDGPDDRNRLRSMVDRHHTDETGADA